MYFINAENRGTSALTYDLTVIECLAEKGIYDVIISWRVFHEE